MPQIITQDGATQSGTALGASMNIPTLGTMTIQSNPNRLLVVRIQYFDAGTGRRTTNVTWGAGGIQALSLVKQQINTSWITEIWTREAPLATTSVVAITFSGAVRIVAGANSLYNVRQGGNSIRGTASATGGTAVPSVTIPSAAYDVVLDSMASAGGAGVTATVGANQSQNWNLSRGTAGAGVRGCASAEPGTTSVTMSWSLSARQNWAIAAISVVPVMSGARLPMMGAGR